MKQSTKHLQAIETRLAACRKAHTNYQSAVAAATTDEQRKSIRANALAAKRARVEETTKQVAATSRALVLHLLRAARASGACTRATTLVAFTDSVAALTMDDEHTQAIYGALVEDEIARGALRKTTAYHAAACRLLAARAAVVGDAVLAARIACDALGVADHLTIPTTVYTDLADTYSLVGDAFTAAAVAAKKAEKNVLKNALKDNTKKESLQRLANLDEERLAKLRKLAADNGIFL